MSEFKVQVKDFQSLTNVELVLEDGLNVVVGKTNVGKSAVYRAVDSAIFNLGKDDIVKVGKRYAGVLIDNGSNKLFWRRDSHGKNEKTMYQIDNGTPQTKVGRTQLPEIAQIFNIEDIRMANGVKEKINFWEQGKAPFLMDKTSGQLFEFLSKSSCDKYMVVTKTMKADLKTQRTDIEKRNIAINTLKSLNNEKKDFIDANTGFDALYSNIVVLNEEVNKFNNLEGLFDRFNSLKARTFVKNKSLSILKNHLDSLNFSQVSKDYSKVLSKHTPLTNIYSTLQDIKKKQESCKNLKNKLDLVRELYDYIHTGFSNINLENIETLNSTIETLKDLLTEIKSKQKKLKDSNTTLTKLNSYFVSVDLDSINANIENVVELKNTVDSLESVIKEYKDKEKKLKRKLENLNTINENLLAEETNFITFKNEIGLCPYCNSVLGGYS